MRKVYALQTAKAGSSGVPGKNGILVKGIPLYLHNLIASVNCRAIQKTYCLTDMGCAHGYCASYGFEVIDLPFHIASADHYQAICFGIAAIGAAIQEEDILVLLLGNSYGLCPNELAEAVSRLRDNDDIDSVCSVSSFNCFNPLRAWRVEDGNLVPMIKSLSLNLSEDALVNERGVLGDSLFFNGSFWIARKSVILRNDGVAPFPWLGSRIHPFLQSPRFELDHRWQLPYFTHHHWDEDSKD